MIQTVDHICRAPVEDRYNNHARHMVIKCLRDPKDAQSCPKVSSDPMDLSISENTRRVNHMM